MNLSTLCLYHQDRIKDKLGYREGKNNWHLLLSDRLDLCRMPCQPEDCRICKKLLVQGNQTTIETFRDKFLDEIELQEV